MPESLVEDLKSRSFVVDPKTPHSYVPVKLAYTLFESKDVDSEKVPVILLHGMSASQELWYDTPQYITHKTRRKVYNVDSRNHGDSEWVKEFNYDINVDDLLHFMDTHHITKAILLGHSLGGITAYKTALKAPHRVEKLVVEEMTVKRFPNSHYDRILRKFTMLHAFIKEVPSHLNYREAKEQIVQYMHKNATPLEREYWNPSNAKAIEHVTELRRDLDGRYTFKCNFDVIIEALQEPQALMSDFEGRYDGPTCVMWGGKSPLRINEDETLIRAFFPGVKLVCVAEGEHLLHHGEPEKSFREKLIAFIEDE